MKRSSRDGETGTFMFVQSAECTWEQSLFLYRAVLVQNRCMVVDCGIRASSHGGAVRNR